MSYITYQDAAALIPGDFLLEALDDDRDGVPEAWATVQAAAERAVDALLGLRYTTPFPPPAPAIVREAALIFACEACYLRRGVREHPFTERAKQLSLLLARIASGELPLDPAIQRAAPSVSIITEPSRTHSATTSI